MWPKIRLSKRKPRERLCGPRDTRRDAAFRQFGANAEMQERPGVLTTGVSLQAVIEPETYAAERVRTDISIRAGVLFERGSNGCRDNR